MITLTVTSSNVTLTVSPTVLHVYQGDGTVYLSKGTVRPTLTANQIGLHINTSTDAIELWNGTEWK